MPLSVRLLPVLAVAAVAACVQVPREAAQPALPAGADEAALRAARDAAVEAADWEQAAALAQRLAAWAPRDAPRRLAVARALTQAGFAEAAQREVQSLAADPQTGEAARVYLAEQCFADQDFRGAADRYAVLAEGTEDPVRRRGYWERCARMAELDGDRPRAMAALRAALDGLELREAEQRILSRMQAFEAGEFAHLNDAALVLREHPDPGLRLLAADFLRADGSSAALHALADAVLDPEAAVALVALQGLAGSEEAILIAACESALEHPAREVRLAATEQWALGPRLGRTGAGALVRRLDPEDRALFRAQCQALEQRTGQVIGQPLSADAAAREALAAAWREWWQGGS